VSENAASAARPGGTISMILPIATAALFVVLYMPVIAPLVKQWIGDPNYQHGPAVPIVSAYILWRRRATLKAAGGAGASIAGITIIVCASILLIGGTAASELFTARLSLPLMIIGLLLLLEGTKFVRAAEFPLLFLFMMIPLPYIVYYRLTFPLQLMSAKLGALLLNVVGIDVIRHGNILALPTYTLEVVTACSGLRSLMTMATLALILCAFSGLSMRKKTILVASSVPIAIAANTIRLAVIAIGAYAVSASFADGILHEISGLIAFSTGLVMLLLVWRLLKWKQ
jgi:exosortase